MILGIIHILFVNIERKNIPYPADLQDFAIKSIQTKLIENCSIYSWLSCALQNRILVISEYKKQHLQESKKGKNMY